MHFKQPTLVFQDFSLSQVYKCCKKDNYKDIKLKPKVWQLLVGNFELPSKVKLGSKIQNLNY
jgi:hypothetical protein